MNPEGPWGSSAFGSPCPAVCTSSYLTCRCLWLVPPGGYILLCPCAHCYRRHCMRICLLLADQSQQGNKSLTNSLHQTLSYQVSIMWGKPKASYAWICSIHRAWPSHKYTDMFSMQTPRGVCLLLYAQTHAGSVVWALPGTLESHCRLGMKDYFSVSQLVN